MSSPVHSASNVPERQTSGSRQELVLEVRTRGGDAVATVPLVSGLVIGRAPEVGFRLDHDTVSRHHAELFRDPFDRWWVRDLGSRNGTRVNGIKKAEQIVGGGDVIRVGRYELELRSAAPQPEVPAATIGPALMGDDAGVEVSTMDEVAVPRVSATQLSALIRFGHELNQIATAAQRQQALCALMVQGGFQGLAAMILRVPRRETTADALEALEAQTLCGPEPAEGPGTRQIHVSRTLVRRVAASGQAAMATNAPRGGRGETDVMLSLDPGVMVVSAVACPLRVDEHSAELLYVLLPAACAVPEWLALASMAVEQSRQAEAMWAARRRIEHQAEVERELKEARTIQQRLLPREPSIPGLEVAWSFDPCRWVGGDYVDVVAMPDGRWFLAVADVCGKGLQAALVASSVHTLVHSGLSAGLSPGDLMQGINKHLCQYLPEASFVTMIAVAMDLNTGQIECINAGHPPPLLIDTAGTTTCLQSQANLPLGIMEDRPTVQQATIPPQQLLAIYTDGWTELMDGASQILGERAVEQCLGSTYRAATGAALREVVQTITRSLDRHRGERLPSDDRTLLLARRV